MSTRSRSGSVSSLRARRSRTRLIATVAALATLACPGARSAQDPPDERGEPLASPGADDPPNVVVIVTDDQRLGSLSVMPRTKRWFRRGGTQFTNAFATTPLCCPSRASIFTGMYAHNHGVLRNRLGPSMDSSATMQRVLHDAGYHTAIAGKYLQGIKLPQDPPHFDQWRTLKVGYDDVYYNANGSLRRIPGYSTDVLGRFARRWVTGMEASDPDPWFLYIAPYAPHQPFTPAPRHDDAPLPRLRPTPAMRERDRSDKPAFVRRQSFDPREGRAILRAQLRTLISVDELVGRLFRTLRKTGEARNTLAFFLSDNGFMLGEHGLYAKRLPYTLSTGIPLLVRWPGRLPGGVRDGRIAANIDVAATVFDAAGVAPEHQPDGRSLLSPDRRARLLLEEYENAPKGLPDWAALRSRAWHYVEYFDKEGTLVAREYYDLVNDPWLLDNLLGDARSANDPDVDALSRELASVRSCEGKGCP